MLPSPEKVVAGRARITAPVLALLLWPPRVARRRPRTAALVLLLLVLAGVGAGLPCYAYYQWRAARAALKDGRLADARRSLDVCLFFWPRSVPVHLLAARAARTSGDFEAAEAHLNRCLKLENGATEDIQLEFLLMRVQTGEVDTVAPELMKYVDKKHPDTPIILESISGAYMHDLRYGPALGILNRWVQEAPDSAQPYYWRGWVWERMNSYNSGMEDYQQALERDPDLVPARLRLAEMYLERSNPAEALPHLERLSRQHPERADVKARLGQCRFLQGDLKAARPLLEAAAPELPRDSALLIHLAKLELQEGRPAEAEKWLRQLLQADPADLEAQYTLVSSLQLQGRQEEAAAALAHYEQDKALLQRADRLLKDEAEHPGHDAAAPFEIGTIFLRIGQARLGEYWLNQALERDPGHKPSHQALAEYYESKGKPDQAAPHRRWLSKLDSKAAVP
jgi:tetratricopeptide (TPR) repeat protein